MFFRVLGPVEVVTDTGPVAIVRRRERCLLAVLALRLNRMTTTDRLAELLWDGEPPDGARSSLRTHLSRLRSLLARAGAADHHIAIVSVGGGYKMTGSPELVDAHRFRSLVTQAATLGEPERRVHRLRQALEVWRGPPLADAGSTWLRRQLCLDLEELWLAAVHQLYAGEVALGHGREILPELAQTVATHPDHEDLVGLYMRALYESGRKAEALDVFAQTGSHLADELGLDPGPTLRDLQQAILRDELTSPPAPGQPVAVDPASPPVPPDPPAPRSPAPRQLPTGVRGFVGRAAYLGQLDALLPAAGRPPTTATIAVVSGTAGIGKTTLVVHWAHRVADQFPDGILYANLRGFDPHGSPVEPAAALRTLLDALDVAPQRVPVDLDAQIGLYRSLLAQRRVLIVLDNARDAEQVRPLLPGAAGCLTLITSRGRLPALLTSENAIPVTLDRLPDQEAGELLAARLGPERVASEPAAVDQLVAACAGLPQALAVLAGRAMSRPSFPLAVLASEVRDARAGLEPWAGSDASTDLRAVFSWSYQALGAQAARLFRLLGLHPGPTFATAAAASLAGVPLATTRRLLVELTGSHLLTEPAPGRFAFHDLLRAFAAELTRQRDPESERHSALLRLYDHYLHTTHAARTMIDSSQGFVRRLPAARSGVVRIDLPNRDRASAWLATELPVLLSVVEQAAADRSYQHAWQLASRIGSFLNLQGHRHHQLTVQRHALLAARRLGEPFAEAAARSGLGNAHAALGEYEWGRAHLDRAVVLLRRLDELGGEATCRINLAWIAVKQGDGQEAVCQARTAADLFRRADNLAGQAGALNLLSWAYAHLKDDESALRHGEESLAIHEEIGETFDAAAAWDTLGYIHHGRGDQELAIGCYRRALEIYDRHPHHEGRAEALIHLGASHQAAGEAAEAGTAWRAALDLLLQLDHPDADEVRGKLDALAGLPNAAHPDAPPLPADDTR